MAAHLELDFNYDILGVTQEYGLDGFSTPQVLAFAIELYEAGILTDQDLPGFPADSGERFFYLVEKIARREGIGDILANGVYWAARQIGKGAEAFDHNTIKKFEQLPLKLGMINYPYFLMYATGQKMNITQLKGLFPSHPLPIRRREKSLLRIGPQLPRGLKNGFWNGSHVNIPLWKPLSTFVIGTRPCITLMMPLGPVHGCLCTYK